MSDAKSAGASGDGAPAKKGKRGLILILVGALILLGGAGGAGWYFLKPKSGESAEAAHAAKKHRIYANLDPFTVNLADTGGERFAQLSVVLEVADNSVGAEVSAQMPAIRNAILRLLSAKQSSDLLTPEGKDHLATEIATATGRELGWLPPVTAMQKTSTGAGSADPHRGTEASQASGAGKGSGKAGPPNPIEGVHFVQFIIQ
jgi:flagellar FliL protein